MIENKHLGAYGIIIEDEKILLIKKCRGPYLGKFDLPGGTVEFCERPEDTLKREFKEETGLEITNYKLFDVDSVTVDWKDKDNFIKTHHIGVFYKVLNYNNEIKKEIKADEINDDSLGAEFLSIKNLSKKDLSLIAILELEKLGYKLK